MTTFKWDTGLETGNEEIDSQHKQWMVALNNIIEAYRQGKGQDEIGKTLDFICDYTVIHFSAEEKLMRDCKYSEFSTHKRYHDEFRIMIKNLTRRLANEVSTDDLVGFVISTLGDWLFNHIKGDDIRMAAYLKTMKNAGA